MSIQNLPSPHFLNAVFLLTCTMKIKQTLFTLFSCVLLANSAMSQERISQEVASALKLASADQIKADITYLADDKLLGRKPGMPGYKMAVDYVVEELKKNGVKPAGDNGTWLQTILLRSALIEPGFSASLYSGSGNEDLVADQGITLNPNPAATSSSVDAGLVFVGYGITAPAKNHDDYKGLNVKGKIVLIVRGAPSSFSSNETSASRDKAQQNAIDHGAIGVISCTVVERVVNPNATANRPAAARVFSARPSTALLTPKGELVISTSFVSAKLKIAGTLAFATINKLMEAEGKTLATVVENLKNGENQSFATKFKMKAAYSTKHTDLITYNVVGKIEGSDPKLKNEFVIHSAHLDHLGVGRAIEGDSIYNGAHDNASGVASLLQITKVYTGLQHKPKRSIIVLMVTGEEMGELGSAYFASHPTVPISQLVADVNTDMPTIIAPLLSVAALGAEHSTLINPVNEASAYLGLTVEPDPEPKENRFVRSDQYSFIKEGIPALHIKYGTHTPDGKNNLNDFVAVWRAKYYHKPQDDINGIFDFEAGKKYAQLNFLIGYLIANDAERPTYNPGDIFEKKK